MCVCVCVMCVCVRVCVFQFVSLCQHHKCNRFFFTDNNGDSPKAGTSGSTPGPRSSKNKKPGAAELEEAAKALKSATSFLENFNEAEDRRLDRILKAEEERQAKEMAHEMAFFKMMSEAFNKK